LALRRLKAFLCWAASEPDLKSKADPTAASAKSPAWLARVRQPQNSVISAYLQCLLLTGARCEELAELKWEDVNFQWRDMELKDKIEGRRAVPLTPFVSHLLAALPRRNEWVFFQRFSCQKRPDKHQVPRPLSLTKWERSPKT
jgi:integrase